jgi:hypothetical protein
MNLRLEEQAFHTSGGVLQKLHLFLYSHEVVLKSNWNSKDHMKHSMITIAGSVLSN